MKLKTFDKQFVMDFISYIFDYTKERFTGIYGESDDYFYYGDNAISLDLDDKEEFNGLHFFIRSGATKMCFIFDELDYVIKIPIIGEAFEDSDDDKEYYISYEPYYLEEENYIELEKSYALTEIQKQVCLENELVGRYNDMPIYVQQKAYPCENEDMRNWGDWKKSPKSSIIEDLWGTFSFEPNFLSDILMAHPDWGIEEIEELDFEDMRNANYGHLKDGTPVIFDYAGFNGNGYTSSGMSC